LLGPHHAARVTAARHRSGLAKRNTAALCGERRDGRLAVGLQNRLPVLREHRAANA